MLTAKRPIEIVRFELTACVGIALAQISAASHRTYSYSIWDAAIGAMLLGSVLLVSRFRRRLGRLIWSGLLLVFVLLVFVGLAVIATRSDSQMAAFSSLELFLSLAVLACNVAAAYLLWSAPASKWLAHTEGQ